MRIPLPPPDLRQGGIHFQNDDAFIESGVNDVNRLSQLAGLHADSYVVDFGCGAGRFAYGLIQAGWFAGTYLGIEVQQRHVAWCKANITTHFPSYRFTLVDTANERYNPRGGANTALPIEAGSVDFFYAYSVFTHMRGIDVMAYLTEIARALSRSGRAFVTVFAEAGVPDETENPAGYGPFEWKGPLHGVLYSIDHLERMVGWSGLAIEQFLRGEYDGQTGLVLRPS